MWLTQVFSDPYLRGILLRALLVGCAVSVCAALLGVVLVLKRFSMMGDGLSHVGFGSLAVASVLGISADFALEFSLPIVMAVAFLLMLLTGKGKLGGDAAIGVISSSAMAMGVILYYLSGGMTGDACNSLFGSASVVTLSTKDVVISLVLTGLVIGLFVLLYPRIFAVTFDPTFARAAGVGGVGYQLMLSALISVTVVVGMKMMGAIMISAIIIFPALTAMKLCRSFRGVVIAAGLISLGCYLIGFTVACIAGLPTGAVVVMVNVLVLLGVSLLRGHERAQ